MSNVYFLLFVCLTATYASYQDTTCLQNKCTLAELTDIIRAKVLAIGNYNCNRTVQHYDNSIGNTTGVDRDTGTMKIYYRPVSGAIRTEFTYGGSTEYQDEFCDLDAKRTCGTDDDANYIQSTDQNGECLGTVFSSRGHYETNQDKELRAVENFLPTASGCIIVFAELRSNHLLKRVTYHSCVRV